MTTYNDHPRPDITAEDLREGIACRQFTLEFQPIVSLETYKIKGIEALLRWQHPEKGLIPPAVFIPLAYQTGLITHASRWVLEESCKTLKTLERTMGLEHDLFMSVNISSLDFVDDGFLDNLYTILSQTDVNPRKLRLELREECILHSLPESTRTLSLCRQAGLGVTVDDFGTNPTFGNHLHTYPIDTVKIAPSLVKSMLNDARAYDTVAAITDHARHMDIKVSAVGVENIHQAQILSSLGCQSAQGYFFSAPVEARHIHILLRNPGRAVEYV